MIMAENRTPHLVTKKRMGNDYVGVDMMKRKISNKLRACKIPTHIIGFDYLKEAIEMVYCDYSYKTSILGRLYTEIAQKFDTKPTSVQRAMRHAIAVAGVKKSNSLFIFDCLEDLKND